MSIHNKQQRSICRCFPGLGLLLIMLAMTGCYSKNHEPDAYGNFEADEVTVSAETNGRLLQFGVNEGDRLEKGQQAGLIDTTMLALSLKQLEASMASVIARKIQLIKTLDVQNARLDLLKKETDRITNLHNEGAATAQQFDKATGELNVALAERAQVRSQQAALHAEEQMVMAKIEAAEEQLVRCRITAPIAGVVLQKYAETGELAAAGKPLFKMAETNELILRAYIAGSQLDDVKIGQTVVVRFDKDKKDNHEAEGMVTWVASSAEFTPKIIQTKEERVDLVYAIKVRVSNPEGRLKIGMPGELLFNRNNHD